MSTDPRTFVSFDYDHDEEIKRLFIGQSKNSKTPFNIQDWSAKSSMPEDEWEEIVKEKINKCNIMIVLVGRYMASATGVKKEIKMAKDQNVPFFGIYINDANTTSNLPDGLARNRVTSWIWENIASAIEQVSKEGKNKN